ncbi:MAG: methyltransferase [Alphaproteobacteria bacterium]|nr:methyltransferase [Alphaproteobacteria bacterium]
MVEDGQIGEDDPIGAAEALIETGRANEAAQALRARIAAGRGGLLARLTLVRALAAAGLTGEALAEAREAVSLNPGAAVAVLALGEALLAAELLPAAIAELQRVLRLDRNMDIARLHLAEAWLKAGEAGQALNMLQTLEPSPDTERLEQVARAMLAARRSDAGYVRHLFDQFAGAFDSHMVGHLGYAGPQILLDLAGLVMPALMDPAGAQLSVLDLGCGTGLAGVVFRPLAARLDGIDLSPRMIEKAGERQIYDHLAVADLETALADPGPALLAAYDLILAADTFVYLGDLSGVLAGAAARLAPGGFLLFTVEAGPDDGYDLGPKRRWRHGEAYLRSAAEAAGFSVVGLVAAATRFDAGQPVPGFAVALMR